MRLITLCDCTDMGGELIVFKTNAPESELKELERVSCEVYLNGGDYEDVPIWANVLAKKGYICEFVASHQHITPYGTSSQWLEDKFPEITETYTIENQPNIAYA